MASPRDPTQFTRESAERIANVVRAAELAPRAARPLAFERVDDPPRRKVLRIATFIGAWPINSTKTVTFKYQTQTPNTASVTNLFFPLVPGPSGTQDCAVAKEGTAWYLIAAAKPTAEISVITNVTLGTDGLVFTRVNVRVESTAAQSSVTIGTTACT